MKLPAHHFDTNTLANMQVGDVRYTLPWGMWVDRDMEAWLHPDYPAKAQPGGTVTMRVERCWDGYLVAIPPGECYKPTQDPGYVSPEGTEYLSVAGWL